MKKMFEKGSDEWKFFVDYYKFIQDYALPEQSDTFWDELFHAADSLCKKYNNKQYYRDLVMAHLNELEGKIRVGNGK